MSSGKADFCKKLNIKENHSNQTISALLKFGNAQMEIKGFCESQGLTFSNSQTGLLNEGPDVGTVQIGWLQAGHLREVEEKEDKEEGKEDARSQSFHRLPVLQFSCHLLGDPTTQQPHQEEDAQAQCDHEQNVVLGGRCHHLHGQVGEALCWGHLQDGARRQASTLF